MPTSRFNPTETLKLVRLSAPRQLVAYNPEVELNLKRLKQWLVELPSGNVVETVESLNRAISSLNELQLAENERLKLLEVYRSAHDSILHLYDEKRLMQINLTAVQRDKLAKDIMWLYLKLAHGYKIIVKHSFDNTPRNRVWLSLAVFRTLEMLTFGLLYTHRCKIDVPPYVSIESHQLYAFAEQFGLLDQPIKAAKGHSKTPTIGCFYALICAFTVIDLSQLNPGNIEPLFYMLEPFSRHAHISRTLSGDSLQHVYMINLKNDSPPELCTSQKPLNRNQWTRFLHLYPMIREIKEWLAKHRDNSDAFLMQEQDLLAEFLDLLSTQ